MKCALETTYTKGGTLPSWQYYQMMRGDLLVGRIESSENSRDIPVLVIDGKAYSWNKVGKMLMSNEGFQIRMEIFDMTDDLE